MLKRLYLFFWGYIVVEIRGNALERFVDQMTAENITLWELKRINKNHFQARMIARDFFLVPHLVRKRLCTVRIVSKFGFPFIINRLKKRYFLVLGFILFLTVFYGGSSFVWFISPEGLENIEKNELDSVLKENGVYRGAGKNKIDFELLEKKLRREIPLISWVDLDWRGTELIVEIAEKKEADHSNPRRIIAGKEGIITELIVLQGKPVVDEGATVLKGQPLVVPEYEGQEVRAIVRAHVWFTSTREVPLEKWIPVPTGREGTVWGLKVGAYSFTTDFLQPSFDHYRYLREKKLLTKWRNFNFSVELIKERYSELSFFTEERGYEQAVFLARDKALKSLLKEMDSGTEILKVTEKDVTKNLNQKNRVKLKLMVKTEMNIAREDSIN
ncbi:MAG: sporulation protein YqfD [Bacillota bacterium]